MRQKIGEVRWETPQQKHLASGVVDFCPCWNCIAVRVIFIIHHKFLMALEITLDTFRKYLGIALSNTFLVEETCRLVCGDTHAAREIAVDILIKAILDFPESEQEKLYQKITTAIAAREPFEPILKEIGTRFPLTETVITEESKAYICKPIEQGNVLARDFSSRKSPLASPSENPVLVMLEWLMAALTFQERQVLLLFRFPDASFTSVAEDLNIKRATISTHVERTHEKLTKRKQETLWKTFKPVDNEFIGDVPDWNEFQRIYERLWRPSVTHLAYCLLGDTIGADRVADSVMTRAKPYVEERESFDIQTAWEGNDNGWIGFKSLIFEATRTFLSQFSEKDKAHAQAKPHDVWALRIKERLTAMETQCFLLSTFFYLRDDDGIREIAKLTGLRDKTVEEHVQRSVRKMLHPDRSEIE